MNTSSTLGSVDSIETMGLVDGPGIRTVVFLNGCKLRCKFCHNPETWHLSEANYSPDELVNRILRNKPYFKRNNGGVTFSGGEPLLQYDFLLETCQKLKKENIHIALDTAGIGNGNYDELLKYIDVVLLDIKHINEEGYFDITKTNLMSEFYHFVAALNRNHKDVWIRQVIIPGVNDNINYIEKLSVFLKNNIQNIKRIDFLPYHSMAKEKYRKLGLAYDYENKKDMSKEKCDELYQEFLKIYNK